MAATAGNSAREFQFAGQPYQTRSRPLSSASPFLASALGLPSDYVISYARFTPTLASDTHRDIDNARREVVLANRTRPVTESVLPFAELTRTGSTLWLFCVGQRSEETSSEGLPSQALQSLSFLNLTCEYLECRPFLHHVNSTDPTCSGFL